MTFLQPLLLLAIPLIGLPILIHLINQNRHRTIHWAATMFLIQARKMATGMARLRYILILIARMLTIAGLIFAVSRPLSGGWLALTAGGVPDTTIIVLDRSVSMEHTDQGTGRSRRRTAIEKLSQLLQESASSTHLVLIDSVTKKPTKLDSASDLLESPLVQDSATASDIPSLLQAAADYVSENETGRTDVWVCSDLQASSWDASGGRWEALRSAFASRQGVRFNLLTYTDLPKHNVAVSLRNVHRRATADSAELVMDLKLTRTGDLSQPFRVPLTFVINGARTTTELEISGDTLQRNGHIISVDRDATKGWGRVELPQDGNPADNAFTFVYAEPDVHRTVIVADDPVAAEPFRIAAATSQQKNQNSEAIVLAPAQASQILWDSTAFIVWMAAMPDDATAAQLKSYVQSGRGLLFVPVAGLTAGEFDGFRWNEWKSADENSHFSVGQWRTDSDLLANTRSGSPLPVSRLQVRQYCPLTINATNQNQPGGEPGTQPPSAGTSTESGAGAADRIVSVLAQLDGGIPLLTRMSLGDGAYYFLGTRPEPEYSTMLNQGVVFYVMIQRAIAQGAAILGGASGRNCGTVPDDLMQQWTALDPESLEIVPSRRSLLPGVFQSGARQISLNRPLTEDDSQVVADEQLEQMFGTLDFVRIQDQSGQQSSLASEIWRLFLGLMIFALLAEAVLCLPDRSPSLAKPNQATSL
ncbi:MAG: BatA domain-containing protein [Planctomyces sp.]|nr:BatA domain-containing protein [Planctomyces sp.]